MNIGSVKIGKGEKIAIQSMCNTDTRDVKSTVSQILELENEGVDIIRVAVPDMEAAEAIKKIKGIKCGFKTTSCPDQLANALAELIEA
jgi:(E)-4-hydroxy-3-methylbut-2-enyl-diphosphate synthase